MPRSIMIVIAVMGVAMGSACSFSRGNIGDEFKAEDVAAVRKGVSTRTEVVSSLGAPDRIVEANGQEIFQYYRYDIKMGSLLLVIANFSRLNIKSDDLYVFFNRDGIVQEVVFGKRTPKMKFQFWPFGD
jgi:outer membrane protein assembly factor BamE (lipoprotein component of BamABCDE complex)